MSQVFQRRVELGVKLAFLALAVLTVAAFGLMMWHAQAEPIGQPLAQPVPFSHKHHVGDDGLDCRYCHTTVETAAFAGMPSTQTCLTCHSQLYRDSPMLAPLHESAATGRPIAWQRVHRLPDFVFFDHRVHIAKGVGCVECHGRVDQMPLTWQAEPLQMQWCLACHRNPAPHLRRRDEVFDMSGAALDAQEAAGVQALARRLRIPDTRRLTDCSTCHR